MPKACLPWPPHRSTPLQALPPCPETATDNIAIARLSSVLDMASSEADIAIAFGVLDAPDLLVARRSDNL